MPMQRRRHSKIRITHEMLHAIMCLPDDVRIDNLVNDPDRRLLSVYIGSDTEPRGEVRTHPLGEAQATIEDNYTIGSAMIERMRETVQYWDERQASGESFASERDESIAVMNALYRNLQRREREGQ